MVHRYDYKVLDFREKGPEAVHEGLTRAAREGYRLLPKAFEGQTMAILERPHEDDEFESMSEEEKARWMAENVEYSRVNPEWLAGN